MDDQATVYISLEPEIQELLSSYGTDIAELLEREGTEVTTRYAHDPSTESGHKEPLTILFGSAAVILSLTPVLKHALSVLAARPVKVERMILQPVTDGQGAVVRDTSGEPLLFWTSETQLHNTPAIIPEPTRVQLTATEKFKISYESGPATNN